MKTTLYILALCSIATGLMAQSNLPIKIDGQIRVRPEADARDFNNDTPTNTFTFLRTRIGALVEPARDLQVYIQFQDSRAFGTETSTLANSANVDLHQAHFLIRNMFDIPLHFKAGRMEMSYGNERLVGAVGWHNVGRAFDGMSLAYGQNSRVTLFSTIVRESHTPVLGRITPESVQGLDSEDEIFSGLYYEYRRKTGYKLDLYGFLEIDDRKTIGDSKDLERLTLGTYSSGNISASLNYEAELALQTGKRRGQDVRAFMLTGALFYTFRNKHKPRLGLGYDFLTGMTDDDEKYKVFDTLFATNHKFYGYMDYFLSIPNDTGGRGLQNFYIKAILPFANRWRFDLHYHHFAAAKGEIKHFGNEVDLTVVYEYTNQAALTFGLSFLAPGDLLKERFQGDDLGVWSYLMFLVRF